MRAEWIAIGVVLAAACAGGGDGGTELEGKLSSNGLRLTGSALDHLTTNALARPGGIELVFDEGSFPGLLDDEWGVELLEYLVLCALPAEQELNVETLGVRFAGHLGLAPEWAVNSCDEACQRWMTACLLTHANALGDPYVLSLRGGHPALPDDPAHHEHYSFQEAAYYGNAFLPPPERVLYGCAGDALWEAYTQEARSVEDWMAMDEGLEVYVCLGQAGCDFHFVGACQGEAEIVGLGTFDVTACSNFSGDTGHYRGCSVPELYSRFVADSGTTDVYDQVITVYGATLNRDGN